MPVQARFWIVIGSLLAALAVALGAYGAHGLEDQLKTRVENARERTERVENYHVATRYHMYHAMAIVLVGVIAIRGRSRWLDVAAASHLFGLATFSGSLYIWALTGTSWLGAVVPIGGLAFLFGWSALAVAAWRLD